MNIILMLIGVAIMYKLIAVVYKRNWDKNLDTNVEFSSATATKGDKIEIIETVVNAKKLPLLCLNIKFDVNKGLVFKGQDTNSRISDKTYRNDVFSLLSNQKITRRIEVLCNRRGVYNIFSAETVFPGAFLNEIMIKKNRLSQNLMVYPKPAEVNNLLEVNNSIMGELERKKYLCEDKFVFAGIRDYQSYDSIRDINWNAYAKTGHLMVNHYNETVSRNVCLLLNMESQVAFMDEEVVEYAISVAAGLSQLLISRGVNVSLYSNGCDTDTKEPTIIDAGAGMSHFNRINTGLARINLSYDMQEFYLMINSLSKENNDKKTYGSNTSDKVYVLISANKQEKLKQAALDIMKDQQSKIWIVPQTVSGVGKIYYEKLG